MNIVVRTLSEQVYEVVRRQILTGKMAPGAPVRQDTIAVELGVSKIPLREALNRLEQDGLLSSYPNRGYVVRPLSTDEASEVFELRLKLEPSAAAEACRKATPEQREAARQALVALEAAQQEDGAEHVTQNRAFHMAMVQPCGLITRQLIGRLHVLAERYVRVHLEPFGRNDRAIKEHRAMLDAWLEGDAEAVERLQAEHIRATLEDLRQQLAA
jgi:DNA-binding GntR family transcriptional regulator